MALPLTGRVAIVTDASRGIDLAIAIHLSSLGANLIVNYITNSTQADLLVSELNSNSSTLRAIAVQADVSNPSGPKTLFDCAEEAFGSPVHIFVNSARITDSKNRTISSMPVEEFDAIFNVNARGAFLCCQEAANRIVRGGGGRIVVITACLVEMLVPNYGAYTASKEAVQTMAKILAKELKGTRITVNGVAPGATATDMFFEGRTEEDIRRVAGTNATGRLGETKDVVPVVGFLCRDEADWVNGQVIHVTGAQV